MKKTALILTLIIVLNCQNLFAVKEKIGICFPTSEIQLLAYNKILKTLQTNDLSCQATSPFLTDGKNGKIQFFILLSNNKIDYNEYSKSFKAKKIENNSSFANVVKVNKLSDDFITLDYIISIRKKNNKTFIECKINSLQDYLISNKKIKDVIQTNGTLLSEELNKLVLNTKGFKLEINPKVIFLDNSLFVLQNINNTELQNIKNYKAYQDLKMMPVNSFMMILDSSIIRKNSIISIGNYKLNIKEIKYLENEVKINTHFDIKLNNYELKNKYSLEVLLNNTNLTIKAIKVNAIELNSENEFKLAEKLVADWVQKNKGRFINFTPKYQNYSFDYNGKTVGNLFDISGIYYKNGFYFFNINTLNQIK